MSNVSINEYQGDLNTLPETISKLVHYQVELARQFKPEALSMNDRSIVFNSPSRSAALFI